MNCRKVTVYSLESAVQKKLTMKKVYFNWSSGKDSAMALYRLMNEPDFQVDHLLVSMNGSYDRVTMHGLRRSVLIRQLQALQLPFDTLELPEQPTHDEYTILMLNKTNSLVAQGFTHAAFGDIFLEDLRNYRDEQLKKVGLTGLYPLWKENTMQLMERFFAMGFRAIIICVDERKLAASFCGKELTPELLSTFPKDVDPCGENGEYHTFCFAGPIFKQPIDFVIGELTRRTYSSGEEEMGFWFCDLE